MPLIRKDANSCVSVALTVSGAFRVAGGPCERPPAAVKLIRTYRRASHSVGVALDALYRTSVMAIEQDGCRRR